MPPSASISTPSSTPPTTPPTPPTSPSTPPTIPPTTPNFPPPSPLRARANLFPLGEADEQDDDDMCSFVDFLNKLPQKGAPPGSGPGQVAALTTMNPPPSPSPSSASSSPSVKPKKMTRLLNKIIPKSSNGVVSSNSQCMSCGNIPCTCPPTPTNSPISPVAPPFLGTLPRSRSLSLSNSLRKARRSFTITSGFETVQGRRWTMEDTLNVMDNIGDYGYSVLCSNRDISYYSVFDGHSGKDAAFMCKDTLWRVLFESKPFFVGDIKNAIKQSVQKVDGNVLVRSVEENLTCGTTALFAVVLNNELWLGNTGDSEAVLGRRKAGVSDWYPLTEQYEAVLMTEKHHPMNEKEKARIEKNGGFVADERVLGGLAMSRAVGDIPYRYPWNNGKGEYVISKPHVFHQTITPDDEFIVLACDGIWDVITPKELVDMVVKMKVKKKTPSEVAEQIVKSALKAGSADNCTVVVVFFNHDGSTPALTGSDGST